MLKGSPGYELGSSSDQIMSSQKGFSEDLITYQTNSYPSELFSHCYLLLIFTFDKPFKTVKITEILCLP